MEKNEITKSKKKKKKIHKMTKKHPNPNFLAE